MFIRTESFKEFRRSFPIITILVAVQLIIALYMQLGLPYSAILMYQGVGFNYLIAEGEYWRLITPIFLHAGIAHVIFNCFSLVLFGPALENILGRVRFLILFFGSGILANIITFFIGPETLSHVGSSGAVYGLFGIYVYMIFNRKDLIDRMNAQIIIIILVIGIIMSVFNTNVNIYGHLFGFVSGAALAPLLLAKRRSPRL
ncbi:rhomboid family intramembrane serine protease [Bacillaceae bacterium SIJ1]|uniref:rhomboid family intramembrane serine protease n=1 Tax=Litoribacterium kuwaitense TaxID=1398745 RepID=UPI0013EB591F|nr:rhomboid family intramembrane serine protease [Litoribacterium kuwaitense]NGP46255.1 rhomboid family intramembrane serine protease [Litoribacterium kuwaitense]